MSPHRHARPRILTTRPARSLIPALVALALGAGFVQPARADLAAVAGDLDRIRVELAALRRVEPAQGADRNQLARFEVRLGQLEQELRELTGRVERLEFEQRSAGRRIDQLVVDLDQRLAALERNGGGGGAASSEGAPDVAEQGGAQERPPTDDADAAGAAPPSSSEGILGTIPESALLGLPRPDPQAATPPERSTLPPQEQYDAAMGLLRTGDYAAAARGLELFVELNPEHELAANAAYWLAETHYVRKDYAAAAAAFARNYRTYGREAAKAPDNLLKLGMSLEGLGERDQACVAFTELAQEFPDAPTHIQQAAARERSNAECG